jgi:hypothetical protein
MATPRGVGETGNVWRQAKPKARPPRAANVSYLAEQIESLQQQGDMYTKKLEVERRRNDDLDKKIVRAQKKLLEQQKSIGGLNHARDGLVSRAKNLRTLENRLEKVLIKYNETQNTNKLLRQTIQNLRKEKQGQMQILDRLGRDLVKKNQLVKTVVDDQMAAAEARENASRKRDIVLQEMAEEAEEFQSEYDDRKAELQEEQELGKQLQARQLNKSSPSATEVRDGYQLGNMSVGQEQEVRTGSNKAYWSIAKKEVDLRRQSDRLLKIEESWNKIMEETEINSIDDIVAEFIRTEEENFSMFNMINELNREMEALEVENGELKADVGKMKGGEGGADNRQHMKEELEKQITAQQARAIANQEHIDRIGAVLGTFKEDILNIFNKVGCNDEALGQQLSSAGVTEMNILQFLGIIEERISELVQISQFNRDRREMGGKAEPALDDKPATPRSNKMPSGIPSIAEIISDDDDDEDDSAQVKPISVNDAMDRMANKIVDFQQRKPARPSKR